MPRQPRCLILGIACHITQRGVDRRETFSTLDDRNTYIELLRLNLADAEVSLLAWCLMSNHVHLVAVPLQHDSLSVLLRRVHGRYAQYYNSRVGRTGHLWQNRFFACMLAPDRLWTTIAYVERNPLRARIVGRAEQYICSSAIAHVTGKDPTGILDMDWWHRSGQRDWAERVNRKHQEPHLDESGERDTLFRLRACTYSGQPFGDEDYVDKMSEQFRRQSSRGRPSKTPSLRGLQRQAQYPLFHSD